LAVGAGAAAVATWAKRTGGDKSATVRTSREAQRGWGVVLSMGLVGRGRTGQ